MLRSILLVLILAAFLSSKNNSFASFYAFQIAEAGASSEQSLQPLPDGILLEEVLVEGKIDTPSSVAFTSHGVLIGDQEGYIYLWKEGRRSPELILDISQEVYRNGARGLQSIAVHPEFETTPHVYILYTVADRPDSDTLMAYGRVARYEIDLGNSSIRQETRTVLLGNDVADGIVSCSWMLGVGAMGFGTDGSLLIATSDGADHGRFDKGGACFEEGDGTPGEDVGSYRAQELNSLSGKILRLDAGTGLGIPSNPFYTGSGLDNKSKIWAYGVREPVGIVVPAQPARTDHPGLLIVGDRGWNVVEEVNTIKEGGQNLGWPCVDGFLPVDEFQEGSMGDEYCSTASSAQLPSQWWHHQNASFSNPPGIGGDKLVFGAQNMGTRYPGNVENRLFYSDFNRGWITTTTINAEGNPIEQELFTLYSGAISEIAYSPYDQYVYFIDRSRSVVFRLRSVDEFDPVLIPAGNEHVDAAGSGLYATYFDDIDFSGDQVVRVETSFLFEQFEGPTGDIYNSAILQGILVPRYSETYTLSLISGDSGRLWLNDSLLVEMEGDQEVVGHVSKATVTLQAGVSYRIKIALQSRDEVQVGLEWSSQSQPREAIPPENLFYTFREQVNLCTTQQATISMSSRLSSFASAENACDGNTDGDFFEGSVAVTQRELNPFWEVDIGEVRDIEEINLWNRTDCCLESLSGAFVVVSESPFESSGLDVLSQPGASVYVVSSVPDPQFSIEVRRPARYVRILLAGEETLHLAEVEIRAGLGNEKGAPPVDGLIAWWSFENGVEDRRGNNNGIPRNGADVVFEEGRSMVLDLDGNNDWMEVPHADLLNGTQALTYAGWIKPASWSEGDVVFSKSSEAPGQMRIWSRNELLVGQAATRSGVFEVSTQLPPVDQWTHVALVYGGNYLRLFVNGALRDDAQFDFSSLELNETPFRLGSGEGDGVEYFHGRIDDAVVYNSALISSDLLRLIGAVSNVSVEEEKIIPGDQTTTIVDALFPNPFESQLTVYYTLKEQGAIEVNIYDNIGRRIRMLDKGIRPAGKHVIRWDGTDDNGKLVSSGVYFVRWKSSGQTKTVSVIRR